MTNGEQKEHYAQQTHLALTDQLTQHLALTDQLTQQRRKADEVCEVAPTPAEEEKQEEGKQVPTGQRLLTGHRPEHAPPDATNDDDKKCGTDSAMGWTQKR